MLNISAKTKLTSGEAIIKVIEYFGPAGYKLKIVRQTATTVYFEGGGGSVAVTASLSTSYALTNYNVLSILKYEYPLNFSYERNTIMKVGLSLGGGGAHGYAHIGVIQALSEAGIKVDLINGTSIGAIIGGAYALYSDLDQVKRRVETSWRLSMSAISTCSDSQVK